MSSLKANFDELMVRLQAGRELTLAAALAFANRQNHEVLPDPPSPKGTYRCIVIDPPWPMRGDVSAVHRGYGDDLRMCA